jgi:hypothetical protein
MEDPIKLHREQIEISNGRTMNIYTFDLDGNPMPEMGPQDIQHTFDPEAAKDKEKDEG